MNPKIEALQTTNCTFGLLVGPVIPCKARRAGLENGIADCMERPGAAGLSQL